MKYSPLVSSALNKDRESAIAQVAVIGCGYWGRNLIRNFSQLHALRYICDSDEMVLSEYHDFHSNVHRTTDFQHVLQDPETQAVVIATPPALHYAQAKNALLHDKDVLVEKPLSLSMESAEELVAIAKERNQILMVGHVLWYHPAVLKLKELINTGELGRIQYICSNRLNLGRIRREENILWSFAPHDISVILGLLDEMPNSVLAQGGNYFHEQIADVTVSLLSFPRGVKAHLFVSWLHPFKEQKLIVIGDRKMAVFDDLEKTSKLKLYAYSTTWKDLIPVAHGAEAEIVPLENKEPLEAECQHFLDCIRTRQTPKTDGQEALRVLKVLKQCQEALESSIRPSKYFPPANGVFVHETSVIDEAVEIGEGTRIWHFSHILKGSQIGRNCSLGQNVMVGPNVKVGNGVKIQNNVSVYESVTLEDYVFCGPSVVFTNVINPRSEVSRKNEFKPTTIKMGATLGANSTILCGITVGKYAFVGAGAVVTKNVPDYALVYGNPARMMGWMCECGTKLEFKKSKAVCVNCKKMYSSKFLFLFCKRNKISRRT